jgi:CBS domain-containing protein
MLCPRCGFDNLPGENECRQCLCDLTALDRPAPMDRAEQSLMDDKVGRLNPRPAISIPLGATVSDAVQILLREEVGALLVVDIAGMLVGIFSERDLLTKVAGLNRPFSELLVDQFMTPKPQTVKADDTLAYALQQMDVGGYRHLPVVRDGKPIGVLSVRDIIRHLTRLCKS